MVNPTNLYFSLTSILLRFFQVSKMDIDIDFDSVLKSKDKIFVLFYASWCPHSSRFLPIFEKHSKGREQSCVRVMIDDKASLMEKYAVEYVPTVLLFEKGKIKNRLEALPGSGLNEKQLVDLIDLNK
jgi:thioredoxin 1